MILDDFTLPGGFQLKLAQVGDAKAIAQLSRTLIEVGLGWSWTPGRVVQHIRHPNSMVIVVKTQERLVGFAILQFATRVAHLNLLAVLPAYQRSGIGKGLVRFLERCAGFSDIHAIQLEVRADHHGARAFYRAIGYQEKEILPRYYRGREHAMRMVRYLPETVQQKQIIM